MTLTPCCSGKAESITIKNEKGRLSQDEIDRMVQEAETFAADDEAQRKRVEALNSLSSFVFGLKSQVADVEGLGGKLDDADKKTILAAVKETSDWMEENASASAEDLEEKLAEISAIVNPITSKLYAGAGGAGGSDDDFNPHDEL
jgi:heat shock protein 5